MAVNCRICFGRSLFSGGSKVACVYFVEIHHARSFHRSHDDPLEFQFCCQSFIVLRLGCSRIFSTLLKGLSIRLPWLCSPRVSWGSELCRGLRLMRRNQYTRN